MLQKAHSCETEIDFSSSGNNAGAITRRCLLLLKIKSDSVESRGLNYTRTTARRGLVHSAKNQPSYAFCSVGLHHPREDEEGQTNPDTETSTQALAGFNRRRISLVTIFLSSCTPSEPRIAEFSWVRRIKYGITSPMGP